MKNETIKRILSSLIILPLILFFTISGYIIFKIFVIIFLLISSFEWYRLNKNKIFIILGIIFLTLSSYSAILLRGSSDQELLLFLYIILVCVATDIGGYVFGRIFKGPKLTKISPNKTYAGVIGAFFFVIIFVFFINKYLLNFASEKISFGINIFILAILISIFSQLGDILISYFKRQAKVKDSGKLIPGHGGLLDRIDGMIFAFPIFYILNLVFKI